MFEATHQGGGWCKNCGEIIERHSKNEDGSWSCPEEYWVYFCAGENMADNDEIWRLRSLLEEKGWCPDCGGLIKIRNPTGKCDHLYYPKYKK